MKQKFQLAAMVSELLKLSIVLSQECQCFSILPSLWAKTVLVYCQVYGQRRSSAKLVTFFRDASRPTSTTYDHRCELASNPGSPFRILSRSFGEKSGTDCLGSRLGACECLWCVWPNILIWPKHTLFVLVSNIDSSQCQEPLCGYVYDN